MDKELQELLDFINHPDFVEPPKYAPKTLRLCGLKLKDAEESILGRTRLLPSQRARPKRRP
jgi:hypothetical protein